MHMKNNTQYNYFRPAHGVIDHPAPTRLRETSDSSTLSAHMAYPIRRKSYPSRILLAPVLVTVLRMKMGCYLNNKPQPSPILVPNGYFMSCHVLVGGTVCKMV